MKSGGCGRRIGRPAAADRLVGVLWTSTLIPRSRRACSPAGAGGIPTVGVRADDEAFGKLVENFRKIVDYQRMSVLAPPSGDNDHVVFVLCGNR